MAAEAMRKPQSEPFFGPSAAPFVVMAWPECLVASTGWNKGHIIKSKEKQFESNKKPNQKICEEKNN